MQGIKQAMDAASQAVDKEAAQIASDLGVELKLDTFKQNRMELKCIRITQKEARCRLRHCVCAHLLALLFACGR